MTESFDIVLLQTDVATGFLGQVVQAGIAFAIMALIIIVLARRVMSLEREIKQMIAEEKKEAKDNILIIKSATEAMTKIAKKYGTDD